MQTFCWNKVLRFLETGEPVAKHITAKRTAGGATTIVEPAPPVNLPRIRAGVCKRFQFGIV